MKDQKKIAMPAYTKEGYHSTHPVSRNQKDNKIRGMGGEGDFKHSMSREGAPAPSYQPQNYGEACYPRRDNKIAGMPPHKMYEFGKAENGRGNGSMRNTSDSENQHPKMGSMRTGYKPVRHSGER